MVLLFLEISPRNSATNFVHFLSTFCPLFGRRFFVEFLSICCRIFGRRVFDEFRRRVSATSFGDEISTNCCPLFVHFSGDDLLSNFCMFSQVELQSIDRWLSVLTSVRATVDRVCSHKCSHKCLSY